MSHLSREGLGFCGSLWSTRAEGMRQISKRVHEDMLIYADLLIILMEPTGVAGGQMAIVEPHHQRR